MAAIGQKQSLEAFPQATASGWPESLAVDARVGRSDEYRTLENLRLAPHLGKAGYGYQVTPWSSSKAHRTVDLGICAYRHRAI